MVDDAVLQQSLTQVDPFLRVARLTDLHQPGHKLTGGHTQNIMLVE